MPTLVHAVLHRLARDEWAVPGPGHTPGSRLDRGEDQATLAVAEAVRVVVDGLVDLAREAGDADRLIGVLARRRPSATAAESFERSSREEIDAMGQDVVHRVLGPDRGTTVLRMSSLLDLDPAAVGRLLPRVGAEVLAEIDQRLSTTTFGRPPTAADLVGLLAAEQRMIASAAGAHPQHRGRDRTPGPVHALAPSLSHSGSPSHSGSHSGSPSTGPGTEFPGGAGTGVGLGGLADAVLRDDDDRMPATGWLWWATGAAGLVLGLAWILSSCNSSPADQAGDVIGVAELEAVASANALAEMEAEIEAAVDRIVAGTGAEASVAGGVVTLSGAVASDTIRRDLPDAVALVRGVDEVVDRLTLVEGAVGAGSILNDELDLDPITFGPRSADLTAQGRRVLESVAEYLTDQPLVTIEVAGHTDADGSAEANMELSRRRAEAVVDALVEFGIAPDRLDPVGYGESNPLVANDSADNKARNRRIELVTR